MTERFGATDDRSKVLRFHTQTGGSTLTAQQPENNIVRVDRPGPGRRARGHPEPAHQRVRRGARAAHRPGRPRSRCAPSRWSATSRGSPTPSTPSPARTSSSRSPTRSRRAAQAYLERIDELGGAVAAIEARFMQDEIEARRLRLRQGGRRRREGGRRGQPVRRRGPRSRPRSSRSTSSSSAPRSPGRPRCAPSGTRPAVDAALDDVAGRRARHAEPAGPHEGGPAAAWPPWARSPTCCAASSGSTDADG